MKIALLLVAMLFLNGAAVAKLGPADALRKLQNAALEFAKNPAKDEFSEAPAAGSALGAPVQFDIALNSNRSSKPANRLSSGYYEYANGVLTPYLFYWFGPFEAYEPAEVIPLRSYTGQTALGRRMTVDVERLEKVGVRLVNVRERRSAGAATGKAFAHDLPVSGDAARQLSVSLKYRIKGNIAAAKDGKSTFCDAVHRASPTLDDPVRFTYYKCTVAVDATSVELVNSKGEVLKSWAGEELIAVLQ